MQCSSTSHGALKCAPSRSLQALCFCSLRAYRQHRCTAQAQVSNVLSGSNGDLVFKAGYRDDDAMTCNLVSVINKS